MVYQTQFCNQFAVRNSPNANLDIIRLPWVSKDLVPSIVKVKTRRWRTLAIFVHFRRSCFNYFLVFIVTESVGVIAVGFTVVVASLEVIRVRIHEESYTFEYRCDDK